MIIILVDKPKMVVFQSSWAINSIRVINTPTTFIKNSRASELAGGE